ncbi:MAG: transcription elongation factor GreA [Chloroflexota bacterium]
MPTETLSAPALLRSLGLLADGPVRWGQPAFSRRPGILLVEMAGPAESAPVAIEAVREWLVKVPGMTLDGRPVDAGALADLLRAWWLPGQQVLYVGRSSKALGGRIAALNQTPLGDRKPHSGGHWLRTLAGLADLRIWWAETDAAEEAEDAAIAAVAATVTAAERAALPAGDPVLPWANLEGTGGVRRPTGLAGSLRDPDAEPVAPARRTAAGGTARGGSARTGASRGSTSASGRATPARPRSTSAAARAAAAEPVAPVTHVTAEGLRALRDELDELTTLRRPEVIARVKSARELGDLRENADYEAARREQSFLEGRIQAIEQMLRTAVVIDADRSGVISLGSTVVAEADGGTWTLRIVGSTEADPAAGRISNVSPVGRALLGHGAGDEVRIAMPSGASVVYRILEVTREP